jgi:hypothetical protein
MLKPDKFVVVLKSLKNADEKIVLSEVNTMANAQYYRRQWRRLLGGGHWTIDRRPGLDTLDFLALTVERMD